MSETSEPDDGEWVIASTASCIDRLYWQRRGERWVDHHGCRREWRQLVDPVDAPAPTGMTNRWR